MSTLPVGPFASTVPGTDLHRWRLRSDKEGGRHVWHYLRTEQQLQDWPQTDEDRYWLELPSGQPVQEKAKDALHAAKNGFAFYQTIQSADGHWSGEYGGPMFLLPGLVIGMYVTKSPIPEEWSIEIIRYLAHRQNSDGGWGLHIEGPSTVMGTALNYVVCRLLGQYAEHPMLQSARAKLHSLGGATGIPSWGKLWLSLLNVYSWEGVNPVPPELWVLPDWLPMHPWRWWIHTRMVYMPMGYLYGRKFSFELNPLIESLRQELYTVPFSSINWDAQRNNIAQVDIFAPHTRLLETLMSVLTTYENLGTIPFLRRAGIKRAYELLSREDENTGYQCLGPVNKMLNQIARYIEEGPESHAFKMHQEKVKDFLWMSSQGLMMCGTNGSQLWDTAFIAQALVDSTLANERTIQKSCALALQWLDECQIPDDPPHLQTCYRFSTKGAWPFSTREQGYTVSDCTAEGLKAVIMLQSVPGIKQRVNVQRMRDSVDLLLTMQNSSGGFASYETINGGKWLEWINPAEVFGDIMIEYDYPECTTSTVTGLLKFVTVDPDYRRKDIDLCVKRAIKYIMNAQRPDGSWFGSWGVCFTYASMFALETLHLAGLHHDSSEEVRRACAFLISKQNEDGGWGETYMSCVSGEYTPCDSQVVQTAWVVISLLHARYQLVDPAPIRRGVKLIMDRQQPNGSWKQERIEGIFNRNCAISYPNFKHSFTIWALGKAHRALADL